MEQPLFTLPGIGDFYLTNTLVALFVVDILVILLAFSFNRAVKKGDLALRASRARWKLCLNISTI